MLIGKEITVLGGGVAGLAAAISLAMRGASVTVLEQAEAIREVGAGLQISPNGMVVLRAMGVDMALMARSVQAERLEVWDYSKGRALVRIDVAQNWSHAPYLFVNRADLIEVLAERARGLGVKIRLLQQIETVDLSGESPRIVTAQGVEMHPDLLIGADGIHSRTRAAMNDAEPARFTGNVAWRAVVPLRGQPPVARVFVGPGRHLVTYPLRGGTSMNVVAVQERRDWVAEGWHHRDEPENLRRAFADFRPEVQDVLALVDEVYIWGLFRHQVARRWHKNGAVILGDAVHPTLPFMAQGAVMALEDAWCLGDVLQAAEDIGAGLARFQARRQHRVTRVVATATDNARHFHLGQGVRRLASHGALRLGMGMRPQVFAKRVDWIYAHDETAQ